MRGDNPPIDGCTCSCHENPAEMHCFPCCGPGAVNGPELNRGIAAHADVQKQGASARAFGLGEFDNPFYKAEAMPAATGESVEEWAAKEEAWRTGWMVEDAIRKG